MPDGPCTLAIETTNPHAGPNGCAAIAIAPVPAANSGVLTEPVLAENPRDQETADGGLLPAIDRLCTKANIAPRDIRRIAVSIGPGGYTAMRTAVVAAKLLSEVHGAEIVPIPTALVAATLARATHAIPSDHAVCIALASKREAAWIAVHPNAASVETPGTLLNDQAFVKQLREHRATVLLADRYLPTAHRATAEAAGVRLLPLKLDPTICLQLADALPAIDPLELAPLYPREPEAVTKWRQRHLPTQ